MWYVDIPDPDLTKNCWLAMGEFNTKQEALDYIRNILELPCDDDGKISLLTTTNPKWEE